MIRVLFFGMLAGKTGCREFSLDMKKPQAPLKEVMEALHARFSGLPRAPYMTAINEEQAEASSVVKDGDEVAIMPPFSGG
ncbi:MAG: MoaD/ThiS family protein [Deltaproteobacteria bacterium]|nr:MoaD/ThiS family protein [Deltaproteobacteria bacterium]